MGRRCYDDERRRDGTRHSLREVMWSRGIIQAQLAAHLGYEVSRWINNCAWRRDEHR
jgi:hypothetical protein